MSQIPQLCDKNAYFWYKIKRFVNFTHKLRHILSNLSFFQKNKMLKKKKRCIPTSLDTPLIYKYYTHSIIRHPKGTLDDPKVKKRISHAILIHGSRHIVCHSLNILPGIAHGYAHASLLEDGHVIATITESHRFFDV